MHFTMLKCDFYRHWAGAVFGKLFAGTTAITRRHPTTFTSTTIPVPTSPSTVTAFNATVSTFYRSITIATTTILTNSLRGYLRG